MSGRDHIEPPLPADDFRILRETMEQRMKDKPFPALCMYCKYAKPERRSDWNHRCFHPKVIARDPWALASNDEGRPYGSSCHEQRGKTLFAPCGAKGKLWEPI